MMAIPLMKWRTFRNTILKPEWEEITNSSVGSDDFIDEAIALWVTGRVKDEVD